MKRLALVFAFAVLSALALSELVLGYAVCRLAPHDAPRLSAFERESNYLVSTFEYQDDGLTYTPDFRGNYFNVKDNRRATTDQPPGAKHTLWLFGSSTVFGTYLADRDTLASNLQRLTHAYRVVNMGMPAVGAAKELRLLRDTPILPGDVVMFYDGSQDMLSPYFGALNRIGEPPVCHTFAWSILVSAACSQHGTVIPTPDLVRDAYTQYAAAIDEARAFARSRGTRWFHFLQPTIFSQPPRDDERPLLAGMAESYALTQPLFAATPDTVDLTHALDGLRSSGAVVYRDVVHVSATANEVIARAIWRAVFRAF